MIFIYNSLFILFLGKLLGKRINQDKYRKIFLFIVFMQMFLIQGLRSVEVGTDTHMYIDVYNNFLDSELYAFQFTHFEYGFSLLYLLLQKLGLGSQWLLIIVSAVSMCLFAFFIYRNCSNVVLGSYIFACIIYPNSFNIMRQALGLAIAINSFYYIVNKKYIKASIIVFIATAFHTTSILMFIPMLLCFVKNWKAVRNVTIAVGILFFIFGNQLISILLPIVDKSFYLNGYSVTRIFRMTTFITIVVAAISWYFLYGAKTDKDGGILLNLVSGIAFINAIFGLLYLKFEFMSRIIEYFNSFLIVSIPLWMEVGKKKYRQIFKLGFYLCCFLLMLNAVFNSGSGVEVYKLFF